MKKTIMSVFLLVGIISDVSAAGLTASVDKTTIPLGEAFVLTLSADENINASPDLSVLQNDFKVYSTSVSRQNYIINGKSEASTSWQIGLIALNPGSQEIPAVPVGTDKTNPVQINVINAADKTASTAVAETQSSVVPTEKEAPAAAAKYNLEAVVENEAQPHYVQQQIIYKVILTDDGSLTGGEPVFRQQDAGNWIIRSLGRPQGSIKTVDGKKVRETVFSYALFPQKSGGLSIPEVWLDGYIAQPGARTGFDIFSQDIFNFGMKMPLLFGLDKPVALRVPSKKINILPAPADYPGSWWLPAEKVTIEARWLGTQPRFKTGEAVSREIILRAVGVTENQLPDIRFPSSPDFRQYPEKAVRQSGLLNAMPVAEIKTVNVYIPEKSGRLTLPEIAVDWYNTQSGTFEQAVIPATEIFVEEGTPPARDYEPDTPAENVASPAEALKSESEFSSAEKNLLQTVDSRQTKRIYLLFPVVFAAGLLIGWLVFKRRPNGGKPQCEMRQYPEYLIKKAYQNDFRSLRDGLVSWATGFYPEHRIDNLKDVASAAGDSRFNEQINIILAKLYNPQDESLWNPKIFSDILKDLIKNKKQIAGKKPPLPPLYD